MQSRPPLSSSHNNTARKNLLRRVAILLVCFVLSVLVHGAVATPYIAWEILKPPEIPGEGGPEDAEMGDGEVGDGAPAEPMLTPPAPVSISMYVEPIAAPVVESAPSPPPTRPTTPTNQPDTPTDQPSNGEGTNPGNSDNSGVEGSPPPGKKNNCDPIDEIVKLGSHHWRVDRELVDYYATHLRELDRQLSASTHRGDDGKADGMLIYLPRCSVLRHGGLRNGDVIHTVNERKVSNIANAVTTYLLIRKQRNILVELTRKNGKQVTMKYRLK